MPVSNNTTFNSVVMELYCPGIDLSQVCKFNIYIHEIYIKNREYVKFCLIKRLTYLYNFYFCK